MSIEFTFRFDYKPVGQGLFAFGAIHRVHDETPCFTWVYDCGSADSPHCLTREIDRLTRDLASYSKIDVLILSHFDRDHINGVSELLRRFRVDRLVIPYLPIEKRLLIALTEPVAGFDFLQTLLNPARQFLDVGGENLGEVVYITSGGHDEPPTSPDEIGDFPPDGPLDRLVKFPTGERDSVPLGDAEIQAEESVSYVSDQNSMSIPGLWEFVFFNKESKRVDDDFVGAITALVESWDWGDRTGQDPQRFIDRLKNLFEGRFPPGNPRNDISLVTYSGPLYSTWACVESDSGIVYPANTPHYRYLHWIDDHYFYHHVAPATHEKCSHLYFGDITLKTRLLELKIRPHFGDGRWEKALAIQVPHHGSALSWFRGASAQFGALASIFSYGLHNTYKHPGKMTFDDLSGSGPILVNEAQGASFCGILVKEPEEPGY